MKLGRVGVLLFACGVVVLHAQSPRRVSLLVTGGSAVAGLDVLKKAGAQNIRIVCIVAAPEGIALVEKSHPDVEIYTPVIDRGLNAQKFILPGLGDFGDRLYGTC